MIGGIYGDLAASTYLRDPKVFYKQLFDEKATISEYGLATLAAANILRNHQGDYPDKDRIRCREVVQHYLDDTDYRVTRISEKAEIWKYDPNMRVTPVAQGLLLNRLATNALISDDPEKTDFGLFFDDNINKPEGYARIFIRTMITRLSSGATKDEVYEELGGIFKDIRKQWHWKERESVLDLLMRAWDCFYNSFDFGSAIHNAVRYPNSNTRQLASLTGLIAESMYGCRTYFIKSKFTSGGSPETFLELPKAIFEKYENDLTYAKKQMVWNNVFWPKNDARTNVEWHTYHSVASHFEGFVISKEIRRRILRSFEPGWDSRYSFYLDNGWIYLCRSFHIIGRFKILPSGTDFKISHIQQSDQGHEFDSAFVAAFDVVRYDWATLGQLRFKYLKNYYSIVEIETECPTEYRGTIKEKFWQGEKKFYETQMENLGKWIEEGKKFITSVSSPRVVEKAKQLGQESMGVLYYICQRCPQSSVEDKLELIMEY